MENAAVVDAGAAAVYRPMQLDQPDGGSPPMEVAETKDAVLDATLPPFEGEDLQQLVPSPVRDGGGEAAGGRVVDVEMAIPAEEDGGSGRGGSGNRKRGRKVARTPVKAKKTEEEEDVCFICFDGGNLVLCDRRFCTKAYHPACVNRDEAFFKKKGKWNCGWHLCSVCQKAAHFLCCTCTYSLCKGCIKESDFLCVRPNKGLCVSCMRLVMLIENKDASKENVVVDFEDRINWEYLFKEYWLDVKRKLALTSVEIMNASNPWKGSAAPTLSKASAKKQLNAKHELSYGSDNSIGHIEKGKSSLKRPKKKPRGGATDEVPPSITEDMSREGASTMTHSEQWASKELLDFVEHMKGDRSSLSVFEVQSLVMDYVTKYKLRDPNKKSQIICDVRLQNLFGKARVGHFEMLKLIESHILIKETSFQVPEDPGETGDDEITQIEPEDGSTTKTGTDRKRKNKKTVDESARQTNTTDYAAIDVHNINLIYLRRNLVEDLLDDPEKFQEKIVGSFVRIRISGSGNKQDMYRLVQVVGTSKAAKECKTGKKSTDVMLEILNLNKTETVTIDSVSNQEFSEEECKRLRQSIKYGFISRLTVGEIRERAKTLQPVKVNDWFETEIQRLSHLRDRASEKGHRKELRECIEKLQVISDPDARARKLQEVPDVHVDSHMDPNYESAEEKEDEGDAKIENHMRPRDSRYSKRGWGEAVSSKIPFSDGLDGSQKNSHGSWERTKNSSAWGGPRSERIQQGVGDNVWNQSKGSYSHGDLNNDRTNNARNQGSDRLSAASISEIPPMAQTVGVTLSTGINETEKMWHYCDPTGKMQGPFSMVQLRKWSTTGYFPADLRIWRKSDRQEDSIPLNDALVGKFHQERSQFGLQGSYVPQKSSGTRNADHDRSWSGSTATWTSRTQGQGNWNSSLKAASGAGAETTRKDGWGHVATDSLRGGSGTWSSQPLAHASKPSLTYSDNSYRTPLEQTRDALPGVSASRSSSVVQPSGTWNTSQGYDKPIGGVASSTQTPGNVLQVQTENLSSKKLVDPTSLASPTPEAEPTSLASPTPAAEPTSLASPTPAAEPTSLASPTPAAEPTSLASPTPAAEPTSLASPTPDAEGHRDATGDGDWSDPPTPTPKSAGLAWSKDPASESKASAPHVPDEPMSPVNNLEQQSSVTQTPKSAGGEWSKDQASESKKPVAQVSDEPMSPMNGMEQQSFLAATQWNDQAPKSKGEWSKDQASESKKPVAQVSDEPMSPMNSMEQQSSLAATQWNDQAPKSITSFLEVSVKPLSRISSLEQQSIKESQTTHRSPESKSSALQTSAETKNPANNLEQRSSPGDTRPMITPAAVNEQLPTSDMSSVPEQDSALTTLDSTPFVSASCGTGQDSGMLSDSSPKAATGVVCNATKRQQIDLIAVEPVSSVGSGASSHGLLPSVSAENALGDAVHNSCHNVNGVSNAFSRTEGDSIEKMKADDGVTVESLKLELDSHDNVISSSVSRVALDAFLLRNVVAEDTKVGSASSLSEPVEAQDALLVNEDPATRLFNPINDLTPHLIPVDDIWDALGPDDTQPVVNMEKDQDSDALSQNHGSPSLMEDDDSIWPEGHLPVPVGSSFTADGRAPESGSRDNVSESDVPSTATTFSPTQGSELISQQTGGISTIKSERSHMISKTPERLQEPTAAIPSQVNVSGDGWLPPQVVPQVSETSQSVDHSLISHPCPIYNKEAPTSTGITGAPLTLTSNTVQGIHDASGISHSSHLLVSAEEQPATMSVCGSTAIVENAQASDTLPRDGSVSAVASGQDISGMAQNLRASANFDGDLAASATASVQMASSDTRLTPTKPKTDDDAFLGNVASGSADLYPGEASKKPIVSETWGAQKSSGDKWGLPYSDNSWRYSSGANEPPSSISGWAQPVESPRMGWNPQLGNTSGRWGAQSASQRGGWEQQKRDGDRYSSYSDRSSYGGQAYSDRPWNRPAGGGGSGGPRTPRAQKVCKFHESGYCKKGASCDFLHP